jgi:ADP-heptose:LPS heptosyltransferase
MELVDLTSRIEDFADTAALLAEMDLLISVDTAAAHLAGAMGKPVWILLPFSPDWRWMLDREDSPWYPGARLFRQTERGQWEAPIQAMADALAQFDPRQTRTDATPIESAVP